MLINPQASWWNQKDNIITWEKWIGFWNLSARKGTVAQDKFAYCDYKICCHRSQISFSVILEANYIGSIKDITVE